MLYYAGRLGLLTSLHTEDGPFLSFLYAALISAVDPVATLVILGAGKIYTYVCQCVCVVYGMMYR